MPALGGGGGPSGAASGFLLPHQLLEASEVRMEARVGAGAFGEVFRGRCRGHTVAVKTMIDVTEKSAKEVCKSARKRNDRLCIQKQ